MYKLFTRLYNSYAVDAVNQLNTDLEFFLDYTWKRHMMAETFIGGSHSRLEKLVTLNIEKNLKVQIPFRQAALKSGDRNMLVGTAIGSYYITVLTSVMRSYFQHNQKIEESHSTKRVLDHGKRMA